MNLNKLSKTTQELLHNCVIHPLYAVLPRKVWDRLHSWHAPLAYEVPVQSPFIHVKVGDIHKRTPMFSPEIKALLGKHWDFPQGQTLEERFAEHYAKFNLANNVFDLEQSKVTEEQSKVYRYEKIMNG